MSGKGKEENEAAPKLDREKFERSLDVLWAKHNEYEFSDSSFHREDDWNDSFEDDNKRFWKKNKSKMKEEVKVLNRGPKGSDPMSMLAWLNEWPRVYKRPSLLDKHGAAYNKEMYLMGTAWCNAIRNDQAREVILSGKDLSLIQDEFFRSEYQRFLAGYEKLIGPVQKPGQAQNPAEEKTGTAAADRQAQQERDYFREDRETLAVMIRELKNAKTFTNSGEYQKIISVAELLNRSEGFPEKLDGKKLEGLETLDKKQIHVLKMCVIQNLVEEYLEHKAADGVKQNVFGKLAAVEKLNQMVSRRIVDLQAGKFTVNGKEYPNAAVYPTFEEEEAGKYPAGTEKADLPQYSKTDCERLAAAAAERGIDSRADDVMKVSECMGRIIRRAENNRLRVESAPSEENTGASGEKRAETERKKVKALVNMREQFLRQPCSYPPTANRSAEQSAKGKDNSLSK